MKLLKKLITKQNDIDLSKNHLRDVSTSDQLGLADYLYANPLRSYLPLSEDGKVKFHWGDWFESCKFQQRLIESSKHHRDRLEELDEILTKIGEFKVWVNNRVKTVEMGLLDIYASYQDPQIRKIWQSDKKEQFQISFSSEMGPYVPLASMRWFDKDIYSCLVFKSILVEKSLSRSFRLGLDGPIICRNDQGDINEIYFHQMMKNGVLVKIVGEKNINLLLTSEEIRFYFSEKVFNKLGEAKDAKDWKKIVNNETFDVNQSSAKSNIEFVINIRSVMSKGNNLENIRNSPSNEYFVFLAWDDLMTYQESKKAVETLTYFMANTELVFNKEIDKL